VDITSEDGKPFTDGDRVYDYYSMKPGIIVPGSECMAPDLWFDVKHDDGSTVVLNGQRICSLEWARKMGWPGA
jgi:hypothetical protein